MELLHMLRIYMLFIYQFPELPIPGQPQNSGEPWSASGKFTFMDPRQRRVLENPIFASGLDFSLFISHISFCISFA